VLSLLQDNFQYLRDYTVTMFSSYRRRDEFITESATPIVRVIARQLRKKTHLEANTVHLSSAYMQQ